MGKLPLPLYPGARIAQLSFQQCKDVSETYMEKPNAKYGRATGTRETMFYDDYEYRRIQEVVQDTDGVA